MVRNWAADRLQYEFSCENIERLASIVIGGVIFGFNIYFSSIMLLAVLLTRKNLLTLCPSCELLETNAAQCLMRSVFSIQLIK